MPIPPTYRAEAVLSQDGLCDVRLDQAGKSWNLCGRYGRRTEARLAGEALASGGFPVLLGAGLGEALRILHEAGVPFAVADKEASILSLTGLREAFAEKERPFWLDDPDPAAVHRALTGLSGGRPLVVAALPGYQRLDPAYYGVLRALLTAPAAPVEPVEPGEPGAQDAPVASAFVYPKFAGQWPRVLLLTSKFFLLGEAAAACKRLGVPCRLMDIGGDEAELEAFLFAVMKTVKDFRPDFILTMNHLGVDREGALLDLLERLELPLASWFLDNPELMLVQYARAWNPHTVIFTWDRDNLAPLRDMGVPHARYLPLATDETRFTPPTRVDSSHPWKSGVSFVGNSMVHKARLRYAFADPPAPLMARAGEVAAAFGEDQERSVRVFLETRYPDLHPYYLAMEDPERRSAFEAGLVWDATRISRAACVGRLLPFHPAIVGDDGWLSVFPDEGTAWRRLPEMSYYDDLPVFYPLSDVNFNVTSKQMKGAVNQRVFDVPACGAFLLTDYRAQMDDLFEPGKEMAVYSHPEEIGELAAYYLAHPKERGRIAGAGRRRVLAEHGYAARMRTMFSIMKTTFGGSA